MERWKIIFPLFWQHGESEAVLRKYMQVIYDANIRAVCIESRPHPDFVGAGWWRDMNIILEEARKRKMKVWILDDSHFPTGYCNGKIEEKPDTCKRWFLTYRVLDRVAPGERKVWKRPSYDRAEPFVPSWIDELFHMEFETLPGRSDTGDNSGAEKRISGKRSDIAGGKKRRDCVCTDGRRMESICTSSDEKSWTTS